MNVADIIVKRISDSGPVSFHDFMETALYYPGLGYYTSPGEKIGKDGDFYTSPYITSSFGHMVARQILEMWQLSEEPEFTIVEYGAGTGILCYDILNYFHKKTDLYDRLNYRIIEKSKVMQEKEKEILPGKVQWYNHINEMKPFTGCILSNEVIDNFSTHKVVMMDELMEVYIDYENGFVEKLLPATPALHEYLAELNIQLPKGARAEINLEAIQWIKDISSVLNKGFVMTIDYGYSSQALYQRNDGTINRRERI